MTPIWIIIAVVFIMYVSFRAIYRDSRDAIWKRAVSGKYVKVPDEDLLEFVWHEFLVFWSVPAIVALGIVLCWLGFFGFLLGATAVAIPGSWRMADIAWCTQENALLWVHNKYKNEQLEAMVVLNDNS
ncbi:MAG: hypothetical protein HY711_07075 [Candidatus Melainabacteria bacterium]|nr:hypothetical protein [Candidatus Melainabacteria bacterium]